MKQVDITKHILVPKFTKLTDEQTEQLLSSLNISPAQLPVIFSKDPVSKAMNLKSGEVVKIERPRGEVYYRRVLE